MSEFVKDNNGIWVATDQNYSLKYSKEGSEICEVLEDNDNFWFSHRNNIILHAVNAFKFSNNYADIGGGNGFQLLAIKKEIPGPKYYLIEPGYDGCMAARKRGIDLVYNCVFQEFDFKAAAVNGFGLFDVLEHIPDDEAFLNALYAAMPADSYLYITVPTYQFLWNDFDNHGQHQRRYNSRSLKALVKKTPFEVKYFSYFFSHLVVPTYLLRTLPYNIFGQSSDEEIIKKSYELNEPAPITSRVLQSLNNYELKRIKSKGKIAFGASGIIVLKK